MANGHCGHVADEDGTDTPRKSERQSRDFLGRRNARFGANDDLFVPDFDESATDIF